VFILNHRFNDRPEIVSNSGTYYSLTKGLYCLMVALNTGKYSYTEMRYTKVFLRFYLEI
jgi:hypothetical protein